jgi:hypothetical protein
MLPDYRDWDKWEPTGHYQYYLSVQLPEMQGRIVLSDQGTVWQNAGSQCPPHYRPEYMIMLLVLQECVYTNPKAGLVSVLGLVPTLPFSRKPVSNATRGIGSGQLGAGLGAVREKMRCS